MALPAVVERDDELQSLLVTVSEIAGMADALVIRSDEEMAWAGDQLAQIVSLKKKLKHKHKEKVAKKLKESSFIFDTKEVINMCVNSYKDRVSRVSMRLKESIWEEYYKKGKKRGRHVKKLSGGKAEN